MLVVEEIINEPETIGSDITGIKRRILKGTDKHSFLNKGNETQVSVKAGSTWCLILYRQPIVNVIMTK